jgi:hypothetical protein
MAHYAFLDENNIVTEVIYGNDENKGEVDWEEYYGNVRNQLCKRTSYNTHANTHPNNQPFRKNYAGIGFSYNEELDAFIPPKPFNSWILNEEKGVWVAPVNEPEESRSYEWNEEKQEWEAINN